MSADNAVVNLKDQKPSDVSDDPDAIGPLRSQVWLTIQTRQAQQLVRGRKGGEDKHTIIGLVGFADRMRVIWLAARNDDPFADWWLIKVHEAITATAESLKQWQAEMDELLRQSSAIEVTLAVSTKPYRMPLQFANPYAYQGANLLSAYDNLICTVLTARHIGLMDNPSSKDMMQAAGRKIRSTFTIPQGYRFLNINRASLQTADEKRDKARQLMGEIPQEVLSGERQAPIMPRKVQFPAGYTQRLASKPVMSTTKPTRSVTQNDDNS